MAPPHALGAGAPHPRGNDGAQLPMGMLNGATSAVVYAGKAHPAELAHAMASAPPGAGLNAGWAPHAAPGAPGARLSVEDLFRMIGQDAVVGGELPRESPPGSQRSAPTPPLSSGSAVGRRASAGAGDRAPPSPPLSAGSAGGALADREFPLHDACSYGDEGRVRRLVEVRHFDVNARAQPPHRLRAGRKSASPSRPHTPRNGPKVVVVSSLWNSKRTQSKWKKFKIKKKECNYCLI